MSCSVRSPNDFFSNSYREGREKFLSACETAGLLVSSFAHPAHKGPHGEDLAMDCTWVGPPNAKKILLAACGTHGLEAAAGAATILQWLAGGGPKNLPEDTAVLIIHAVNPYGWAYARRGNENGIDLNRNCVDHRQPYPENSAYGELHALIKKVGVTENALEDFTAAFHEFSCQKGRSYAVSGVTGGQYAYPDGISYGGAALSWSCQTVFKIARTYLEQAEKVLFIDWHTGIGSFGEPFFIMDDAKATREYALAASWWPSHEIHSDDIIDGASPNYTGLLTQGLKDEVTPLNQAQVVSLVIEWGTYDVNKMLQALLMDRWLCANSSHQDATLVKNVRASLIERFYPSSSAWRNAVLSKVEGIYTQALSGIERW